MDNYEKLIIKDLLPFEFIHNSTKESPVVYHGGHDEVDDYKFTFGQFLVAGGIAGFLEHTAMFPVDTVKTRMQAINLGNTPHYRGTFDALKTIVSTEGLKIYRGVSAAALGAIPSHALYFCSYEYVQKFLKPFFKKANLTIKDKNKKVPPHFIATSISAAFATMMHDGISTPTDVVKQRMQLYDSKFKNIYDCAKSVYKTEGMKAFFRSYPTTLIINIPYTITHFYIYETMKHALGANEETDTHHHYKHLTAGAIAGASAAAISTPIDVIKTRLQTQGDIIKYNGIVDTSKAILKKDGWSGFLKGTIPRMMYFAPSAAITWCVYEYIKFALGI